MWCAHRRSGTVEKKTSRAIEEHNDDELPSTRVSCFSKDKHSILAKTNDVAYHVMLFDVILEVDSDSISRRVSRRRPRPL